MFEHNGIPVTHGAGEKCCGMPKLELGDLDAVEKAKETNIPVLAQAGRRRLGHRRADPVLRADVQAGTAADVPGRRGRAEGRDAFFDPFEYLMLRHKAGKLKTDFEQSLGKVAYQAACHQRVQNIGLKTRDVLRWCRTPRSR